MCSHCEYQFSISKELRELWSVSQLCWKLKLLKKLKKKNEFLGLVWCKARFVSLIRFVVSKQLVQFVMVNYLGTTTCVGQVQSARGTRLIINFMQYYIKIYVKRQVQFLGFEIIKKESTSRLLSSCIIHT